MRQAVHNAANRGVAPLVSPVFELRYQCALRLSNFKYKLVAEIEKDSLFTPNIHVESLNLYKHM